LLVICKESIQLLATFLLGIIICIITGNQQYSIDHPHGGLDVPCWLIFKGSKEMLDKIIPLLQSTPQPVPVVTSQDTDSDKNSTSSTQSSTGISELVVSVNFMSVATVSIAVPDSVGDTGTNDLILWVEVGRTHLLLADK